ncbi:unnamed protein product [Diamesa hyperborea]
MENTLTIDATGSSTKYMTVEFEGQKLRISTTAEFVNYELNEIDTLMTIEINFVCIEGTRRLNFYQNIKVVNNYAPAFSKTNYEIKIPTPLPKGLDVTMFMMDEAISAIDYDLKFYQLEFTVSDTTLFSVESRKDSTSKRYTGIIKTSQQITKLTSPVIFTITAMDSFEGNRKSSSVTVKVFSDPEVLNIDPPSFNKPLYKVLVEKDETFSMEEIVLNVGTYTQDVEFIYSGKDLDYFQLSQSGNKIQVQLSESFNVGDIKDVNDLMFEIEATKPGHIAARTVVLVRISKFVIVKPKFEKSIYIGHKPDIGVLDLENIVIVKETFDKSIIISLQGEDANLFEIKEQNENVVQVGLKNTILETEKEFLQLVVEAKIVGLEVKELANIFISVGQKNPATKSLSFRKSIYEGTVTKEMKLIVEKVMLNEDNLDDDVVIQLSGRNQQFFTFTKTSSEVLLTLKEGVTFDQLPNIPTLLVSVDAISDKFRSASTNVVVTIVQESDDIKVLSFSKSIYEGSVTKEMKLIVEKVKLNEDNLDDDVVIQLSGRNQQFFTFTKTSSEVLLTLKEGVTFDQLPNIPTLLVSVDAISDKFRSASTNVVVTIVQESDDIKVLSFSKSIYEGSVTKEMKLIVEKVKLNEDNLDDDVVIQLSGRNQQFFTFTKTSSEVLLTLKEGVTFDQLPNIPTLLVSVDALSDKFRSASTNVVFSIVQESDDIKVLSFSKSIYEGSVTKEMKLIVEKVKLNEDNLDDDVVIQLSGRNQQFFTFTKTSSEVLLTLKEGVTFDQLPNIPTLLVSVDAISDKFRSASTNVVVTIVQESDDIKALSFSKSIYEGTVTREMKLIVEKVMLNEDNLDDDVVIQLSGRNQQFFTFTKTSSEVLLTLKEGVTFDQLPNIPTLLVAVDAISDKFRSASTNVVVTIVQESDDIKALSFSKSIYEGSVTKEMKLIVEKVKLNEDNLDDDVVIQLSGRNQQFFTFTKTSSEVLLTLKEGVTFDQLPNIPTLLVSVDALSDKFRSASTNVVISLWIEMNSDLKFQKSLYIGSVNNLKQLLLENLLIESNNNIDFHIEITGDDKDLFSIDVIDNSVTVSLQKDITEDLWNSRVILIINITATFNGMKFETIVVITLPKKSEDKLLLFEKPSYIGSIDLNTVLDLEQIVLELNNYDSMVTFEFSGMNSDLFAMQVDRNSVSLQLKEGITIRDFENIVLITLEIKAKRVNFITGMTIVFLQLPWKVEQVDFLSFDKVSYRGKFNIDKELLLDTIKLEPTTFSNEVIVSLKGDDAGVFSLEQKRNEIELIMRQFTDLENRSIFNLYVEAVKFGAPKAYANVVIDVEKMKKLSFDSLIYVGKLNADYTLHFKVTTVSGEMSANDVSFVLKSDVDIDLFEVKRQGNDLVIVNSTQITDDHLVNKLFFSFYLEASKDKFYSAMSLIIIEIPRTNSSVPIEDCIDKSDPSQPFFETGAYSFVFQSDMKGSFGKVKAMIVDPKMGRIQYKLQTQDDYLSLRISVNAESGHLIISKELAVGLYTVTAVAINTENNKMAYTRISIIVESARICTEDALTTVQKTLAIEALPENIDYNTILPTVIGNCELDIFSVNPSALRELFIIDRTTHFLTSLKFDREDPLFVNQTVPQIQLKLNLNCDSKSVAFQNYTEIQEQHLILTDDILFSTDLMILNIVIEDQNDNFPVFTYPATKSFTVGYPEQKLADKLLPPNLMIVEAFDVDEGLNAKIKYTLNVNRHFAIDPEAGIIYPLTECMLNVSEVDLVVTATDRFGALDGNAESFNLKVRKVTKDNLVVLTTENEQLSDVELFLRNISGITKMNLLSIHYAAIPHDDNEQKGKQLFSFMSRLKMNEVLTFIKVFVYAFDVEGELKTSDGIIELLKISNIPVALNVEAFVDDVPDYNLTGFIIAVSLLGGLLITVCAAIPLLWFLWLSPKLVNSRRKASESSIQQFEEDFNNSPANTSPVLPIKTNTVSDKDILGIQVDGATVGESPNVLSRLEVELGLILDGREVPSPNDSINSEKKKTNVRFNELVERIEVLADVDDVKVEEEEELNERL